MQIVIKIDDNLYTRLFDNGVDNYDDAVDMAKAIRKGTPLPEHHGRIGDLDIILTWLVFKGIIDELKCGEVTSVFRKATILEADNEIDEMEQNKPIFPCIEGALAEMYVDGKWIKGKIVKGYRFDDGIVTIEDDNGHKYWCGQDRTDLYRRYRR